MYYLVVVPPIIAFLAGARWGRRGGAVGLALCILGAVVAVCMAQSGAGNYELRGSLGFASTFGALAALGPLVFRQLPFALLLSAVAIALFIFSGLPLFAACGLFGACEAYP